MKTVWAFVREHQLLSGLVGSLVLAAVAGLTLVMQARNGEGPGRLAVASPTPQTPSIGGSPSPADGTPVVPRESWSPSPHGETSVVSGESMSPSSGGQTPVASPESPVGLTPTPTPAPKPAPGTILYQADWSSGLNGWPGAFGWKVLNGMLLNDGSNQNDARNWIAAPYEPGAAGIADYAVEAEIQQVKGYACRGFGIVVREGYQAGVSASGGCVPDVALIRTIDGEDLVVKSHFDPTDEWHTYRVEVKGNSITLMIDGAVMAEASDNRYLSGGKVGLWSYRAQVSVRSFKVIAL